jgi:DNA invertase Pin-like site-specific DNA recombinase
MNAAAYVRVSSLKRQKTDAQRAELEAWAKRHRFKNLQWFEDREISMNMSWDPKHTVRTDHDRRCQGIQFQRLVIQLQFP